MDLSSNQESGSIPDWSHNLLIKNESLDFPQPPPPPNSSQTRNQQQQQRQPLKCPRCDSFNTKFCYYNNYSRAQPRHFCKACRRHWTEGGTLRNVPVGGGRKNKRSKTTHSNSSTTTTNNNTNTQPPPPPPPPQLVLPFGRDQRNNIFPDFLLPPLDYSNGFFGGSPFSTQFGATTRPSSISSYDNIVGSTPPPPPPRFSNSTSVASHYYRGLPDANSGGWPANDSRTGGLDSSSLGYWSGWDDDITVGFVGPEIRRSTADGPPRP